MNAKNALLRAAALIAMAAAAVSPAACDPGDARNIALVKAGYIVKIPMFVEWPAAQWRRIEDPIVIDVLGDSRMFSDLIDVSNSTGHVSGQRAIVVREFTAEAYKSASSAADVLYISGALCEGAQQLLRIQRKKPVLSVSDCGNFIRAGGMFRLLKKGASIALEANRMEIERAGLLMSFRLATVATIVTPETSER